jgi:hypothetical protein
MKVSRGGPSDGGDAFKESAYCCDVLRIVYDAEGHFIFDASVPWHRVAMFGNTWPCIVL